MDRWKDVRTRYVRLSYFFCWTSDLRLSTGNLGLLQRPFSQDWSVMAVTLMTILVSYT